MIIRIRRKKGSLMIEISVAIFMILVCFFCYEHSKNILLITNQKRMERHNNIESIEALSKEIKYNVPYSWIRLKLADKEWNLRYDEEFIYYIEHESIENLTTANQGDSNKVEIKAKHSDEKYMEIEIKLIANKKVIEKNITKYPWMDYV